MTSVSLAGRTGCGCRSPDSAGPCRYSNGASGSGTHEGARRKGPLSAQRWPAPAGRHGARAAHEGSRAARPPRRCRPCHRDRRRPLLLHAYGLKPSHSACHLEKHSDHGDPGVAGRPGLVVGWISFGGCVGPEVSVGDSRARLKRVWSIFAVGLIVVAVLASGALGPRFSPVTSPLSIA